MDLAARDAFATHGSSHRAATQFRAACSSIGAEDQLSVITQLEMRLGMHLCLFPIAAGDFMKLLSLSFVHACFAQASTGELVGADEEEPGPATGYEER